MAKYGPSSIIIEYDNAAAALVNITAHVLTINNVSVEELLEEIHSFGKTMEEHLGIGVGKVSPVELGGLFDDTAATGPDALFANRLPEGPSVSPATRTLKLTWGGTKTTSVETKLAKYDRIANRTELTKWAATLQPTGAVTEV